MTICVFDPGIEDNQGTLSSNLGDLVIQDAVTRELRAVFGDGEPLRISTQTRISAELMRRMRACTHRFVGGTNLLASKMRQYRQWEISLVDAWRIDDAILLGVGWWDYQNNPDFYTRVVLRAALSRTAVHSVRDSYTLAKLRSIGFENVINTGCPTMWPLADLNPHAIPIEKADIALLMLTDYRPEPELDRRLFELLRASYSRVYFWPQGRADLEYVRGLGLDCEMLDHSLPALDDFLRTSIGVDYVGTRLHGGVHCLLAGRRSLVLEVDNRAREIARDTGLPTTPRNDFDAIRQWIAGPTQVAITMNTGAIAAWRRQFAGG